MFALRSLRLRFEFEIHVLNEKKRKIGNYFHIRLDSVNPEENFEMCCSGERQRLSSKQYFI